MSEQSRRHEEYTQQLGLPRCLRPVASQSAIPERSENKTSGSRNSVLLKLLAERYSAALHTTPGSNNNSPTCTLRCSGSSYSDLSESLKEEFIEEVCRLREEYKEITSVRPSFVGA